MATYVVLFNWTEQGIKSFKDSPGRVEDATKELEKDDVRIKSIFWTIGPHDLVAIIKGRPEEFERVMVRGTENLLAAAKGAGVGRFVLMSALGTRNFNFKIIR